MVLGPSLFVSCLGVVERGVLAAGVAVMDELDLLDLLAHGEGHPERVEDEVGAHVRRELPAGWKKFTLSEGTYPQLSACGDGQTEQLVVGRFSTATQPSGTGVRVANPST